jgi:hypothetical protein
VPNWKKVGNNNVSNFSTRWQIPAMLSSDFIIRNEGKRQIRPKKFDNCISTNIVIGQ